MDIQEGIPLGLAAKRTSLAEHQIRRGLIIGTIKGFKVARDWVLPPEEVDRLATEHPVTTIVREG